MNRILALQQMRIIRPSHSFTPQHSFISCEMYSCSWGGCDNN